MKKQIFILIVAVFAISLSTAYGQVIPRAITCLSADALHPVAGTPYTYTISVPNPSIGTKSILWFVTQDQNFLTDGNLTTTRELEGGTFLAKVGSGYNAVTDGQLTMDLTWKNIIYDPLKPVFIVIDAINVDGSCSPNNMKVYEILPTSTFTLDIANIQNKVTLGSDYGTPINKCISNIVSATYNTTTKFVDYDYGLDTLMYEVVAANWTGQWKPSVQLTGIDPKESVTVVWSDTRTFTTTHAMTGSVVGTAATPTEYLSADNVTTLAAGNAVGTAGESIFIRVILDHTVAPLMYEGITDEPVALAVDGFTYSETVPGNGIWTTKGVGDVHHANGGTAPNCNTLVVDGYTNDFANQTVKARPDVQAVTPTPFITAAPKP